MKRRFLILLSAFFILVSFASCNDTSGAATIVAYPEHHGKAIYGATVYVIYNAIELPLNPTTNFDLVVKGDPKEPHVHVEGLRDVQSSVGQFYLYAVGYDTSAAATVKGGLGVKISWSDKDQEKKVFIAVSE